MFSMWMQGKHGAATETLVSVLWDLWISAAPGSVRSGLGASGDALMGLKMGHSNGYFSYFFIGNMIRIQWIWHTNGYFETQIFLDNFGKLLRNFKQPEREWLALVASSQYNFWEMKHPIYTVHWYSWRDLALTGHELIWHYITFALLHIIYSYITGHLLYGTFSLHCIAYIYTTCSLEYISITIHLLHVCVAVFQLHCRTWIRLHLNTLH